MDRRLAVFAAGHHELDDPGLYTVDITRNALPDEESRTTTIDYLRQAAQFAESSTDAFYTELVALREHLRPAVSRLTDAISGIVPGAIGPMFRVQKAADENDLNAKLAALIGSHEELLSEHPSVPFACARVTPDHTLVDSGLLIEAKFVRDGTPPSRASEGIAADLVKYPPRAHILFLVCDPYRRISDDEVFRRDFETKGRCTITILR